MGDNTQKKFGVLELLLAGAAVAGAVYFGPEVHNYLHDPNAFVDSTPPMERLNTRFYTLAVPYLMATTFLLIDGVRRVLEK